MGAMNRAPTKMNTFSWFLLLISPFLVTFAAGGVSAAPWVPTLKKEREVILKQLPLKRGSIIYDLGCGDGVVLFSAAKQEPGIRAIGYEISLVPYLLGKIHSLFFKQVSIRYRNFFSAPIADADIVFCFLLAKCYPRLIKKLATELKPEALVVIEAWPFPGIEPLKTIEEDKTLPVYLYTGAQLKTYV